MSTRWFSLDYYRKHRRLKPVVCLHPDCSFAQLPGDLTVECHRRIFLHIVDNKTSRKGARALWTRHKVLLAAITTDTPSVCFFKLVQLTVILIALHLIRLSPIYEAHWDLVGAATVLQSRCGPLAVLIFSTALCIGLWLLKSTLMRL